MPDFKVVSPYEPAGDQPEAIAALAAGIENGLSEQALLGVTGSGKTFTMAKVIEKVQKPTLVLAHNKTLAAQLCAEFKEFFPDNAVEYFVSYYDYYQPEAYIPHTDTFIEKDSATNDEIDRLRLSATASLIERRDVIVVSSVSCIYGLGEPDDYARVYVSFSAIGNSEECIQYHLVVMLDKPVSLWLINSGTRMILGMIPRVITQAMAENTLGSVMVSAKDRPNTVAVEVAAGSSYVIAPTTLSLTQGSGRPRNFDSVTTPSRIDTAGAMVKTAVDTMILRICFISIPISLARLKPLTRKNTDWAMTNRITSAASTNKKLLFGLKFISFPPSF